MNNLSILKQMSTSYSKALFAVPKPILLYMLSFSNILISFQLLSFCLSRRFSPLWLEDELIWTISLIFLDEPDFLSDETWSEGEDGTLKQNFPPKIRRQSSWLFMMWINGGAMQHIPTCKKIILQISIRSFYNSILLALLFAVFIV